MSIWDDISSNILCKLYPPFSSLPQSRIMTILNKKKERTFMVVKQKVYKGRNNRKVLGGAGGGIRTRDVLLGKQALYR
jgi:hypothetical protein